MQHQFISQGSSSRLLPEIPKIFLPGWGFDGRILQLGHPPLSWVATRGLLDPETFTQDLQNFLEQENIRKIELIGWSMGAHFALDFAHAHPALVDRLTLISLRNSWPKEEIDAINAGLAQDREAFLTTFYRKCFLGDKKNLTRFIDTLQPGYLEQACQDTKKLERGLSYLARAICAPAPGVTTHLIHGAKDIISPPADRARLASATEEFLDGAGHLPFLSPDCSLQKSSRKETVRAKFAKAAASYDAHAQVQSEVAAILAGQAKSLAGAHVDKILELGCGTGNYTRHLARNFRRAQILALDFAEEMLATARPKLKDFPNTTLLRDDCEDFLSKTARLHGQRYHLITGNGTLQWFADLESATSNIAELLTPDGLFLVALFGPATLNELGLAMAGLNLPETSLPATTFPGADTLKKIVRRHFEHVDINEKNIVRKYGSVLDLLTHIKKTGTAGWREGETPVLTTNRLRRLDSWFQDEYGECRVTYQIFFVNAAGPIASPRR